MDMGSMGHSPAHACKISMLLNWYVEDACFISAAWHIRTRAQFAGTIIGVFFIAALIEGTRRLSREFDRRLTKAHLARIQENGLDSKTNPGESMQTLVPVMPFWREQLVRGFLYGLQYTAAFFVMLLGMSFNVPVLIAIFTGATFGYIVFGRDTLLLAETNRKTVDRRRDTR
ncbi:hypothetical protein BZG36_04314 [Bifiguratus adelaidae]|uniref:Copper transport protein n=1 Tax=Bifiguratus adelaidae TaxID=1938954 RepID=A0A261XZQ6_9FUNG|nr:hypothetical protein BZG36_04314 [Bifiguratus adelaidae]